MDKPALVRTEGEDDMLLVTCQFEKTFTVPRILMEGTVNEVQNFLQFFDSFYKREKELFAKHQLKDVGSNVEEMVRKQMEEEHRIAMQRLQRDLDAAERRCREVQGEAATMRGQLDAADAVSRNNNEFIVRQIDATWRQRLKEVREEQERSMTFIKEQLAYSNTELKAAQEKLMARESVLKSSVRRGKAGEDSFAAAAEAACGWQLDRISDQARACDFKMDYNGCTVRFEIKNHETSVPGEDIKKFRRDMEEHRNDTGIGVFCALNAHLGGFMRGRVIHQEWKDDSGQLFIYISAFNELDTDFVFLLLKQVFDVFLRYKALRENSCEDDADSVGAEILRGRIDNAMIHAQTMAKHLKELTLKTGRDKKTVMKMYDDSLELLKSMSAEYSLTLEALLSSDGIANDSSIIVVEEEEEIVEVCQQSLLTKPGQCPGEVKPKKKRATQTKKTNSISAPEP